MWLGRLGALSARRACHCRQMPERGSAGTGCGVYTAGRQGSACVISGSCDPGAWRLNSPPGPGARLHCQPATSDPGAWRQDSPPGAWRQDSPPGPGARLHYHPATGIPGAWRQDSPPGPGARLHYHHATGIPGAWRQDSPPGARLHYHPATSGSYDTGAWRQDSSPRLARLLYPFETSGIGALGLDSSHGQSTVNGLTAKCYYHSVTNGNHDPSAWKLGNPAACTSHELKCVTNGSSDLETRKLGNTSRLYAGNGFGASRHYRPVTSQSGAWKLDETAQFTSSGFRAKLDCSSVTNGSLYAGARRPGNIYGQYTDSGLRTKPRYLPAAQQYVRSYRAVISQEKGPVLSYYPRNPFSREGCQEASGMSQTEGTCWNCQDHVYVNVFFCPSCSAIQPPDPTKDYFQIMDSERSFTVNVQKLQETYRNLQRLLHPDYFSQKSQKERDLSEIQSSLVNKAYRTLLTPLSRGIYLLKLNGVKLAEGTDSDVDMPFILEIMELNEKLEEAHSEAAVQDIGNFVEAKYEELTEDVSQAFDKGDVQEAKLLLIKMKYFSNLQEKVKTRSMPS